MILQNFSHNRMQPCMMIGNICNADLNLKPRSLLQHTSTNQVKLVISVRSEGILHDDQLQEGRIYVELCLLLCQFKQKQSRCLTLMKYSNCKFQYCKLNVAFQITVQKIDACLSQSINCNSLHVCLMVCGLASRLFFKTHKHYSSNTQCSSSLIIWWFPVQQIWSSRPERFNAGFSSCHPHLHL